MNVLLMVADDLGYGDVGYQGGRYKTPNIDALAKQGVVLTSYYGHHNCTPSRACFMTGRYASRYGLQEVLWPWSDYGLALNERLLPVALKEVGYSSYVVGKWHLGYKKEYEPLARGFDYHYGCYATPHYYTHINYGGKKDWYRNGELLKEEGYVTDLIKKDALKVIKQAKEPYFLYVPFTAPHKPIIPPQSYTGDSKYAGVIESLDDAVGAIVEAFQGMIIFCVDNGSPFKKSNGGLRGKKHTLFEGGVRLPAIVAHPKLKHGVIDEVVHAVDIYPTILKQCGASLKQPLPIDGQNIMPVLRGAKPGRSEILFNANGQKMDGLRVGDYKYIENMKNGERYLFDVRKDKYESVNLIDEKPHIVKQLSDRLNEFRKQTIKFLKTRRHK